MARRATGGKFGLNFVGICRRWRERKVKNEVNTTLNKEKKDTFLVGFCAIFFSREGGHVLSKVDLVLQSCMLETRVHGT